MTSTHQRPHIGRLHSRGKLRACYPSWWWVFFLYIVVVLVFIFVFLYVYVCFYMIVYVSIYVYLCLIFLRTFLFMFAWICVFYQTVCVQLERIFFLYTLFKFCVSLKRYQNCALLLSYTSHSYENIVYV